MSSAAAGWIYIQANSNDENEIVVFNRSTGPYCPAGGSVVTASALAWPSPLRSRFGAINAQGSVALSADGQHLFAVMPGSNEVSSFAIVKAGPGRWWVTRARVS